MPLHKLNTTQYLVYNAEPHTERVQTLSSVSRKQYRKRRRKQKVRKPERTETGESGDAARLRQAEGQTVDGPLPGPHHCDVDSPMFFMEIVAVVPERSVHRVGRLDGWGVDSIRQVDVDLNFLIVLCTVL